MSFFGSLFSMGVPGALGIGQRRPSNPADAAQGYFNQVPAMAQQNLSPYIQRGTQGDANATNAYNRSYNEFANPANVYPQEYNEMGQNPMAFVENIMRNYEPSAGYNYKQNRMRQEMRNSAASGGFAGTEYDQNQQADMTRQLLGEDMQQFLNNIFHIQKEGSGGRERGFERGIMGRERALAHMGEMGERQGAQGAQAAASLADILGSNLGQQGAAAYQGGVQNNEYREARQRQRNNMMRNMAGMMFGGIRGGYNGGMGGNAPSGGVYR